MRIKGKINGVSLVVLLDTGSIHSFIDATIVSSLHLIVDQSQTLEVKVDNGAVVKTQAFCNKVPVCIQGEEFFIQFHVLHLWVMMLYWELSGLLLLVTFNGISNF